jgi:hypothetical protein
MHTFLLIIQTIFNSGLENKIPIRYLDGSVQKYNEFYQEQSKYESTLPVEKRRGLEKQFFIMFILSNRVTVQTRLRFFKDSYENIFMNDETREKFLVYYLKIQRTYRVLSKFAFLCKYKSSPVFMNKDVYLNTIDEDHPRVFTLVQNNKKYLFSITDLINILNTSLGNSFFFVSEPLPCKNPYTNIPFNKSTLYNIYFFIKKTNFIMPPMFHQYFLSNFDLRKYFEDNEELIREYSIKQYVNNSEIDELYYEIISMLNSIKYGKKMKINPEFPKEKLVEIMRPYLELYYKGTHTIDEVKRERYIDEFDCKMKRFYEYNKTFGRAIMNKVYGNTFDFNAKQKYQMTFNDKHIHFHEVESENDFLTSHIEY